MPKEKGPKKGASLRHAPLGNDIEQPAGKLRAPKAVRGRPLDEDDDSNLPSSLGSKIYSQARSQRLELSGGDEESFPGKFQSQRKGGAFKGDSDEDDDDEQDDDDDDDQDYEGEELVEFDGEIVAGTGLSEAEEAVVQRFLGAGRDETRTLADIIMDKIREKGAAAMDGEDDGGTGAPLPPKVVEVYTAVGKLLAHYKSGKLPKALKMLPHLKNWEEVLWLTRPDQWSPCATYACTRIFASNLNAKLSQRFLNLVLLEKCRDDIQTNKTLNYHLYMALKKALFKPAAFYKGILLPIAQSQSCTLREAVIIGSVLAKVSIPANHSAAALVRLAEMPYCGSTSVFIRVLLNKKYALPRRVLAALVDHFTAFEGDGRDLPVVWHQALLVFAQRYKFELDEAQRHRLKNLIKVHAHHQIAIEVKKELSAGDAAAAGAMKGIAHP